MPSWVLHSRQSSVSRMRENLTYGLTRGRWKPVHGPPSEAPFYRKKRETDRAILTKRRHCSTLQMRNILAKLPRMMQGQMKRLVHQVFRASSHAQALKRGRTLIAQFRDRYPAAMECLERDLQECVTYLRFPAAHQVRIRTTNRLERLNGEGRRRTKVIPRFPTERSCLALLFASLVTASKRWRGVKMTPCYNQATPALARGDCDNCRSKGCRVMWR